MISTAKKEINRLSPDEVVMLDGFRPMMYGAERIPAYSYAEHRRKTYMNLEEFRINAKERAVKILNGNGIY